MILNVHDSLINCSGIYKISNAVDGRIYIGSTIDFYKRYKDHKRKIKLKTHANKYLQSFNDKYGSDSLIFEVVCICKKECLLFSEKYFIELLLPHFNIKKIIERKYFEDELGYSREKNKIKDLELIDSIIPNNDNTDNLYFRNDLPLDWVS